MTLTELKALRPRDRVVVNVPGGAAIGRVNAADELCVEVFWNDGTSSLIWFAHCLDGRDPRHTLLTKFKRVSA